MSDASAVDPKSTPGSWLAPVFTGPGGTAHATVRVPGSKSLTNRYLLLAALADSPSLLRAPLHSRDSALMIAALEALGARCTPVETGSPYGPDLRVEPIDFSTSQPLTTDIECGLAGTVMRFVPPVAALLPGSFFFDGDRHARQRPMAALLDALRQLNVSVLTDAGREATGLPFRLESSGLASATDTASEVIIDASASSQFVSALLLVAPRIPGGLLIRHRGNAVPSIPHIEMTVQTLRELGVRIDTAVPSDDGEYSWRVYPGAFTGFEKVIEPDLSNAGPFLAAAMVTGASVSVPNWPSVAADGTGSTTQVGDAWRQLLPQLGGTVTYEQGVLRVKGPADITTVAGANFDLHTAGELAPTLAAIAALAGSQSTLSGIGHLRGHETDRLAALSAEINRLGGSAQETSDGIRITAPIRRTSANKPVLARTYADHRMATFAAIIGLRSPGVVVENIATVAKTLPDFTAMWESMLTDFGREVSP